MLFLVNMASKMNHSSALGSRIAEVHNGSSLFTGDAGQGESNDRNAAVLPEFSHRIGDVSAHQTSGQHDDLDARKAPNRTNRLCDPRLPNQRDRVHADPFASEVVPVCFRNCP